MPEFQNIPRADELSRERELLRRSLQRSTAAAVLVLLVAVGLAVAVAISSSKARRSGAEATENLWGALNAEAGGGANNRPHGSKQRTLDAIDSAVAIRPSPGLRDRAIEALARTDLRDTFRIDGILGDTDQHVTATVFTPDFGEVFVGCMDGEVIRFHLPSGDRIGSFKAGKAPRNGGHVSHLWRSPDGRYLGMRYYSGAAIVWQIDTGEVVFFQDEFKERSNIDTLAFDPARPHWLFVSREGAKEVRVFDLVERKTVASIQIDGRPVSMSFDSTGERLAVKVEQRVETFSWKDEKLALIGRYDIPADIGEIDWLPDREQIAVAGADDLIHVIDLDHGGILRAMYGHRNVVHHLGFSPTGDLLLSDSWDSSTRLWDTESGIELASAWGVSPRQFSHDGRQIGGYAISTVHGYEIDRSDVFRPLAAYGNSFGNYLGIAFSPDGHQVAAGSAAHIAVWSRRTGRMLSRREDSGQVSGVAFSSDGKWLLAVRSPGDVLRWPVGGGGVREVDLLGERETVASYPGGLGSGEVSRDGRWFSFLIGDAGIGLIDLEGDTSSVREVGKATVRLTGSENSNAVVSSDGRLIACTHWRATTSTVYDFESGGDVVIAELECAGGGAQFSPDSKELALISKAEVVFWDTESWARTATFQRPFEAASYSLGINWSPDGRLIAVTGEHGRVHLLDGRDPGHPRLATLTAPFDDRTRRVEFSPDCKHLAATAYPGKCHLWNLGKLEGELAALQLHWGGDATGAGETLAAEWSNAPLLAGIGALAALVFGVFTLLYQRNLIRRFAAAEAIAEQRSTELIMAQSQLAQSEKMKALGTLSAGVAHDFKNLLSVIKLSNDLIRRDASGREDLIEEVDAIGNAVAQGDQVVKAMLGYSRGADSSFGAVDVPDVVEGTVALLGQQFLSGVRLQLDIERHLPKVDIPQGALEQILLNLVVNASEAMGGRGKLAISAVLSDGKTDSEPVLRPRAADRYIAVRVSDDGPGMDAETLGRIFEPFFTTKTIGAEKGTGLGLATVYKIARDNGLGLSVESHEGEGTRFGLALPV